MTEPTINPHDSDGTSPEACSYCGDVWPCAASGRSDPNPFPHIRLFPCLRRKV